jgi:hypothetical protein
MTVLTSLTATIGTTTPHALDVANIDLSPTTIADTVAQATTASTNVATQSTALMGSTNTQMTLTLALALALTLALALALALAMALTLAVAVAVAVAVALALALALALFFYRSMLTRARALSKKILLRMRLDTGTARPLGQHKFGIPSALASADP